MVKAIELNLNTQGYLLMSDDVLLKYWNLYNLDVSKIWFPTRLICIDEIDERPRVKELKDVWAYFDNVFSQKIAVKDSN